MTMNEKEFLEWCLSEWERALDSESIIKFGAIFSEMRNRLERLS